MDLPLSCLASGSGWGAFHQREVFPVPVDRSYPVALRADLGEVPVVDLAVAVPAAGASTAGETVHPVVLLGRDWMVVSGTVAEFHPTVELGFARPVAC